MEVGEELEEPVTVREDQVITIQASSLLPEAAGMASQSLRGHIYLYLLMSFLVGGSKVPCEKHLRSRKPLLESLQWEAYWVPLMIILGGCCAMAWSILFIAYDVGREGGKMLPQIPGAQEEEQKEGGARQAPPEETKEDANLLESKNSKELLGTPLEIKRSREGTELNQKGSQEAIGSPQQSEEKKGAKEGLENQLEIKRFQDRAENQLERNGSHEGVGFPFSQGANDSASFRPNQGEDQPCGKLWVTMEKELERLLQLLRFCRSSGPGPLVEGSLSPAVEEATPPPATETPNPVAEETLSPTLPQETPTIPSEEAPRSASSRQSPATMHLVICGLPSSACLNRSQRRRDRSRGRK
ncbi:uncharacterized protein LOC120306460 [Crotalus tigris]|uniref:uncharacterized protein LOC120306460 n=1 Tax=Crotalus tigris TaxID=88082 RepID=UPI00192F8325|nr:uncharacterized protein LOC120306460 [Crotalus tigris]